jgi:nitroimidazol reductase NimA-like FMN-containing flavoprotein (pyridoxamine 5'-phosphate oxidase superfamily)
MVRRGFEDIQMTQEEIDEFLQVPRYGALATVKSGERPHIDPVGFNYLDGKIYFSCEETRVLVKRMRNNPNGFFSVFDDSPPASAAVQLEGPMRIVDDPDDVISRSIIRRHAAENLGDEFDKFVNSWLGNGKRRFRRVVIELTPTKVFAWNNRKTAAARRRAKAASA